MIIRTKKQLENAINNKETNIIVEGKLAEKIRKTENIQNLNTNDLIMLVYEIGASQKPAQKTGGLSLVSAIRIGAATGLGVNAVRECVSIGINTVMEIYSEYDIEIKRSPDGLKVKLSKH